MLHAARHILNFARCMLRVFCCTLHASMRRTHFVRAAARMERLEKEKRERKEAGEQYLKNNGAAKLNSSAKGKRVDRAREHGQTTQKGRVSSAAHAPEQTNKRTNRQTSRQTNKQTNKQTNNQQTDERTRERTNE
jgi:hypothetical protein